MNSKEIEEKKLDMIAEDSADEYVANLCERNRSFNVEDTYIEGFKAGFHKAIEYVKKRTI